MKAILSAATRDPALKAKALLKAGLVPGNITGLPDGEEILLTVSASELNKMKEHRADGGLLTVKLGDKELPVIIRRLDRDGIKGGYLHISMQYLDPDREYNGEARIVLLNRAKIPGYVAQLRTVIPYTAKPADMFDKIELDLAGRQAGTTVFVGDLSAASNPAVTLTVSPELPVVTITASKSLTRRDADSTAGN